MPVAYHPQNFWQVVFSVYHSGISQPRVWLRTITLLPLAVGLAALNHYVEAFSGWETEGMMMPFGFLVAVITSSRPAC